MALVCPVGHPPGTGSFCRLCGRDYIEETVDLAAALEPSLAGAGAAAVPPAPVPPPVAAVPPPAAAVMAPAAAVPPPAPAVMAPPPPPAAAPAPVELTAPLPGGPPATAYPGTPVPRTEAFLPPAVPPAPPAFPPPSPLSAPLSAPEGAPTQVHLQLVEAAPAAPAAPAEAFPTPGQADDAVAAESHAEDAEDVAASSGVDRMTVVASAFAGFLGGLVSGAGISIFLS